DRPCAGRSNPGRSPPQRDTTIERSGPGAATAVARGVLQRPPVPRTGDAGDRASGRMRRSSDRRLGCDRAAAIDVDRSTIAIAMADRSAGDRLRLPTRCTLDPGASGGELAADLGGTLSPVPPQLRGGEYAHRGDDPPGWRC